MTKRRRNKRHSRTARDQRLNTSARVWMWESQPADPGNDFVLNVASKTPFGWVPVTQASLIHNLLERTRNWVVCGRALVLHPDGKMWMEQADMTLPSCKLLETEGAYDTLRALVLSANQTRHVFDCGWIARPWLNDDPTVVAPDWVYHDAPA